MSSTNSTRKYPMKIGKFCTQSDRHWNDPDQNDILATQQFNPPYRYIPPRIIIGLTDLDIGTNRSPEGELIGLTIGVKSSAEAIDMAAFEPRISIWGDGVLSSTTCTWLETAGDNPKIQSGVFRTTRHSEKTSKITFETPFETVPKVLVFLAGFQLSSKDQWDVGGDVKDITETGFTIEVKEGEGAVLHQSLFSWMAFVGSDRIRGGRVDGISIDKPGLGFKCWGDPKTVDFGQQFEEKPQVAQWISRIKTDGGMRIRFPDITTFEERKKEISKDQMTYNVETWSHTKIYAAEMSWVAVASPKSSKEA